MKPIPAIVESAVDVMRIGEELRVDLKALRDSDAKVAASEKRIASDREENAQRRLAVGRTLVKARQNWPARGPRAKGWGDFLEAHGLEQSTAFRLMQLAGYVEVSCTDRDVHESSTPTPTYAEAGIDKRPRKVVLSDPQKDWQAEVSARRPVAPVAPPVLELVSNPPTTIHISRRIAQIGDDALAAARELPGDERQDLVMQLRMVADVIEGWK